MAELSPRRARTPFLLACIAGFAAISMIPTGASAHPDRSDRGYFWTETGPDTLSREQWLQHAIRSAMDRGDLEETPGNKALSVLEQIHRDDVIQRDAAHHPGERIDNAEEIQDRLDDLADSVKFAVYAKWHRT